MNAMTSEANKKNMLIIDGNSILNRAFFGMPALTNSRGADTGALYGMMTIILPKLEQLSPLYAAVAYDLKAPTFRHKLFTMKRPQRRSAFSTAVPYPQHRLRSCLHSCRSRKR